ncbi:hypothetical protein [Bosea eneae]|uniref:hypothetical protein n=1 Tax=Bosea eneae TaxID=151454 RepID=UPI00366EC6B9
MAMLIAGVIVLAVARSAFHEITAATAFGLGAVILGISAVIDRLTDIRDGLRQPATMTFTPEPAATETRPPPKPDPEITWRGRGTR